MARPYRLKKRAERQEDTRRRIVEAAVDLHTTLGPGRTPISAIAEQAGVERHTYYRHFPDDRDLFKACTGLYMERNPVPDPAPWRKVSDPVKRLRRGLGEMYAYYERNEPMLTNVVRDAEDHPPTREMFEQSFLPQLMKIAGVLAEPLPGSRRRQTKAARARARGVNTGGLGARPGGRCAEHAAGLMAMTVSCVTSSAA
jgi:AcrR family transcriptional regulator